jgi:hypothetical protein
MGFELGIFCCGGEAMTTMPRRQGNLGNITYWVVLISPSAVSPTSI